MHGRSCALLSSSVTYQSVKTDVIVTDIRNYFHVVELTNVTIHRGCCNQRESLTRPLITKTYRWPSVGDRVSPGRDLNLSVPAYPQPRHQLVEMEITSRAP